MSGAFGLFSTTLTLAMGVLTILFCSLVAVRIRNGIAVNLALPLSMMAFVATGLGVWLGSNAPRAATGAETDLVAGALTAVAAPVLAFGLLLIRRVSLRSFGEWGWIALIAVAASVNLAGVDRALYAVAGLDSCY